MLLFSFLIVTISGPASAQTYLRPNGSVSAYEVIESVLGRGTVEHPDCGHASGSPHIIQAVDAVLNRTVFFFTVHLTADSDRCRKVDRQRTEVKVFGPSPEALKGRHRETVSLSWTFRLDAHFQPSRAFTSIHQIKDFGGSVQRPIIAISARFHRSGNRLELIHVNSAGNVTYLAVTALAPFLGQWIHVTETLTYDTAGKYSVAFSALATRKVMWSYANEVIDLWRSGATFVRPKWGIYRGVEDSKRLRDETVKFGEFCFGKGNETCA